MSDIKKRHILCDKAQLKLYMQNNIHDTYFKHQHTHEFNEKVYNIFIKLNMKMFLRKMAC